MKKTLLLVLAVLIIAVMVPAASFAQSQDEQGVPEDVVQMSLEDEVQDGWQKDATTGKWMYFEDGQPKVGKVFIGVGSTGHWYFFDAQGLMQVGFQTVDPVKNTVNFFDKTTGDPSTTTHGQMQTGWLEYNNAKYYLSTTDGARYTGINTIKGSKYYFADNGKLKTGFIEVNDKRTYYGDPKSGKLRTGWLKLSGKKYYFDTKSCKIKLGWYTINKDKYYFDAKTGAMHTSWLTLNSKKYYLGTNGKMVTGFKTISKKKYYFKSNGVMQTGGPVTIKGYKYYFSSKGVMQTGAIKIGSALYYFYSSGKAVKNTGWFKGSDKKQRYSLGGGKIATGTRKIGSYWYTFSATTGVLLGKMDQADRNIQNIASSTKYLVQVLRKSHQTRVYTGKKGAWTRIYTFTCSVGDKENPTPLGDFKITKKVQKHESTNVSGVKVRCWGKCTFYKDTETEYSINSILYRASDGTVYDGRLGANCTQGTVRLSYNNAMWIFYNAPINTRVHVAA